MLTTLAISGYRSLRDIRIALGPLTVVTGANGSGKSSLYRALRLIAAIAGGGVIRALAREGGLPSTFWAGPEKIGAGVRRGAHALQGTVRDAPMALKLGFATEDYGYAIDLGMPAQFPATSLFNRDPHIKAESMWTGPRLGRANEFASRRGPSVRLRGETGEWQQVESDLASVDSMLTHCADPTNAFELLRLRELMRAWRFYDHFRSDAEAPARQRQIGTYTPVLASDGADLAAALQTILEIGDADALRDTIADAFPRASVAVVASDGNFALRMHQHGLLRPLEAAELSDGTLRFLLLVAALLSPRPPALMILNEPENSLHPDLIPSLARLIRAGAARTQIVLVSHSAPLLEALVGERGCTHVALAKEFGETVATDGAGDPLDPPAWAWPTR